MDVADFTSSVGCFLNLNELEFSENNAEELKARGFRLATDENNSVEGSRLVAEDAFFIHEPCAACMRSNGKCGMNFCSSRYKDRVQLRLRLLRIAEKAARPFDTITEDGTLSFGKIVCDISVFEDLKEMLENELPEDAYEIIDDGKSDFIFIETAPEIAEELSEIFLEAEEISEIEDVSKAEEMSDEEACFLKNIRENIRIMLVEKYPFNKGFVAESEQLL